MRLLLVVLLLIATPSLAWMHPGGGGGGSTTLTLASYVNSGFTGNAVQVTVGWTGATPVGAPATWSGAGGSATITGFTVIGAYATFYASTPASAGTYTLAGTGWTTGNVVVSAAVSDLSTGINGPTNVMLGQDSYGGGITPGIASYVPRGLAGPTVWSLTGTHAAGFTISGVGVLVPVFDGGTGTYGCNATVCNVTINASDGVTTLTPVAVTVQRPVSGTDVATIQANTVFDTATANGSLSSQLGYSAAFVTNVALWGGAASATFSDPSGHFALVNSAQIAVRTADLTAYGTYPLTITPAGGSAFVYNVSIAHERNPVIAWVPDGTIYSSTPATNGYGSNRIGVLASSDDATTLTYAYTSNPTGALDTYNSDPYPMARTGFTYLLSSVSAGTLSGTAAVTSTTTKSTSIVFTLPVAAGTTLASSNVTATVVTGLDNFQPSAQIQSSGAHMPGSTKVADLSVAGMTPNWALTNIDVVQSNAQLTVSPRFFYAVDPKYLLSGASGTTTELHAWHLEAVDETTPQVDDVIVTLTDGAGTYVSKTVSVSTAWHTCTQGALSVGPGGTWATGTAMGAALNGAPSTYAGCTITVLRGVSAAPSPGWQWTPYGGSSYYNWLLMPIHFKGDSSTQASFTGTISGTALTVSGVTGTIAADQWIATGAGTGFTIVSGSGTSWVVNKTGSVGPVAMTTQWQQIPMDFAGNALGGNGQGCMTSGGGYDIIFERIEVANCGGGGTAGAFFKTDQQGGNMTLRNNIARNSDNGVHGGSLSNRVYLIDNLFVANGNPGSTHNIYIDDVALLVATGNYSVDSSCHALKSRAMFATVTNNYFLEGMNWYGWCSPVQQAQSGNWTVTNNVIMKGVNDNFANNGNIVEPFNEWTVPMWADNTFTFSGNTIINLVVPGQSSPYQPAVGISQVSGNADPVRGIPFIYDITSNGFWNLAQAQWSGGSFGATAPTFGTGNFSINAFPSTGVALINPLTGAAPTTLPYRTRYYGMIGSAAGSYDMVMTVAAGAAAATNITGGLVTGRGSDGVQMTGQSVSALTAGYSSSVASNNIQLKVPAGLTDGIEYPALTITGSGTATLPGITYFPLIVGTGGSPDGFVNGAYLPSRTYVSPDLTTSSVLMTGFVRGSGTPGFTFSNSCGGAPCMSAMITATATRTTTFSLKPTAAGLALAPTGGFPAATTITITDSLGTYVKNVSFNALASGTDIAVPGGNVLPATQSQSGGRWVLSPDSFLKAYTPTPPSTTGQTLLPNNTFSTYVRCAGDEQNLGYYSNQAHVDSVSPAMLAGTPFFVAGFMKPEDHSTFGMIVGMGNNTDKQFGLGGLTAGGGLPITANLFEWDGPSTFRTVGQSPTPFATNYSWYLGQWLFTAVVVGAGNNATIYDDGLTQAGSTTWVTPTVNGFNPVLSTTFCSYEQLGGDAHNFNGGIRNWVWVDGVTPTTSDLNNFRSNPTLANAQALWPSPAVIRGFWEFTADPQLGQQEPDLSGNGKNLTYLNGGTAAGSALPYLVTTEVPWIMDGSGNFEIAVVSGTTYQIKTTAGVSSLPAVYGTYEIILVDKYGREFPTTIFVTDGS